jgi:sulfite exporter TauE/SafE
LVAWLPGLIAVVLWKSYGGHLHWPELLNLLLGHWLRMLLSGGLALAAAALAESAASAAIVTLSFTLGTWALDFIALGVAVGWRHWLLIRRRQRCAFLNRACCG